MQANVVAERGGLAEAFVAEAADERLLEGVNAHVRAKVTL